MTMLDNQWDRIIRLTELFLTQGTDDLELSEKYIAMLKFLQHDCLDGETHILGMMRAPASANRHHAFEGGLVKHLLEMWEIWTSLHHTLRSYGELPDMLNDSGLVWRAILHHDLNKVWKYKLVTVDPWKVNYAQDSLTALLTDTHKSIHFLGTQDIHLPVVLHNALITAEGGFSVAKPRAESVFSKVVYILDELSANVLDRLYTKRFWDSKIGGVNEVP
jgi:hypothetical protein